MSLREPSRNVPIMFGRCLPSRDYTTLGLDPRRDLACLPGWYPKDRKFGLELDRPLWGLWPISLVTSSSSAGRLRFFTPYHERYFLILLIPPELFPPPKVGPRDLAIINQNKSSVRWVGMIVWFRNDLGIREHIYEGVLWTKL